MPWPTWDQAALATLVLVGIVLLARRSTWRGARAVAGFCQETALISFLYMIWRLARQLPLSEEAGAYRRAEQIFEFQRWLHLPDERSIERWTMQYDWLANFAVTFYATAHVPVLLGFLVWLYVRQRQHFGTWRNVLAITTGFCLFIRFLRVAPPRLMPELGFVDLSVELGRSVYGHVTASGASDQFAAMPSIHIAWAAVVAFGAWAATPSRWRWLGMAHLVVTFWAVMATANHWWLDGLVALALIWLAWGIDRWARAWWARRQSRQGPGATAPAARVLVD